MVVIVHRYSAESVAMIRSRTVLPSTSQVATSEILLDSYGDKMLIVVASKKEFLGSEGRETTIGNEFG